jgi:hypothetical protein
MPDSGFIFPPAFRVATDAMAVAAGGTVEFYLAGTNTATNVYSDSTLTTSLGSTVYLDSGGHPVAGSGSTTKVVAYTGAALIKLIVKDSGGATLGTYDNVRCSQDTSGISGGGSDGAVETIVSKTADYTVLAADDGTLFACDPSGGTFALTLPSAVTVGDGYEVAIRHSGTTTTNRVRVVTTSSQTIAIDGLAVSACTLVGGGEVIRLASNGGNWVCTDHTAPKISENMPLPIADRLSAPPGSPTTGAWYIVASSPTGAWSTFSQHDLVRSDGQGGWHRYTPTADCGWLGYLQDEDLLVQFRGSAWVDLSNIAAPTTTTLGHITVAHQLADGTAGGTVGAANNTWYTRALNTTVKAGTGTLNGVALATNTLTNVPAGTYFWSAALKFGKVNSAQFRIRGTTAGILDYSPAAAVTSTDEQNQVVPAFGVFTLAAADTIYIENAVSADANNASACGGAAALTGVTEVYATLTLVDLTATQGPQGAQGIQGNTGAAGLPWSFATSTSMANPGAGYLRLNNATLASVTAAAISDNCGLSGNPDVAAWVLGWDDSTTQTNRGTLVLKKATAQHNVAIYEVTGASTDNSGWTQLALTHVSSSGAFAADDQLFVEFSATGDSGTSDLVVTTSTDGQIKQGGDRLLHTFTHPTGSSAVPDGRNIFLGRNAGNFTLGSGATSTSHASHLIGIGVETLDAVTTGGDMVAIGSSALGAATTGSSAVGIGRSALGSLTSGSAHVAIGLRAMQSATTATTCVAIGQDAMAAATTSFASIGIGVQALLALTTGNDNIALGNNAGRGVTTAGQNIAIGNETLRTGNSARNIAIGTGALNKLTSGDYQVAIGHEASYYQTSGVNGVMVGYQAGRGVDGVTTARWCTGIGFQALTGITTGEANTALGWSAGAAVTTGAGNTFIGSSSGLYGTTAEQNTAVGAYTMGAQSATLGNTSSYNVAVGVYALRAIQSGDGGNTAVGYEAGRTITTGFDNTLLGSQAGWHITTGGRNTQLGNKAGDYNYTASDNTLVGWAAGYLRATGNENTFVGASAGRGNEQVLNITGASGNGSTVTFTFSAISTAIETGTTIIVQSVNPSGYNNYYTVTGGTTTSCTVASAVTASYVSGGTLTVNHDITGSVVVGFEALRNPDTGADYNHIFGYQAGFAITTGANNTLLGYRAGNTITTGSRNLLLGYDVDTPLGTTSNYMSIGNLLFATNVDGAGTTVSAGALGIKTATPAGTLLDLGGNVCLERDADDTLALRRSTTAQMLRVYNTYTSSTNNEFLLGFDTNVAVIGTVKGSGGGTARALALQTDGTTRWTVGATSGHILCASDGGFDIGQDGASRPNNLWVKSSILADTQIRVASGGALGWRSRSIMTSPSDGVIRARVAADTSYSEIQCRTVKLFPDIGTIWTPTTNGEIIVEFTSNTSLTFKCRGSDGINRSVSLTLS